MRKLMWLVSAVAISILVAAYATSPTPLDTETRAAVIDDLLGRLKEKYVFVDVAEKMEEDVRERQSEGEYDGITDRAAFADALTGHLQEVSHDKHLRVMAAQPVVGKLISELRTELEGLKATPSGSLYRTEHLPGGVGYMEVPGFPPPQSGAGAAAASAMNELNDTDALIFDLRACLVRVRVRVEEAESASFPRTTASCGPYL